MNDFNDFQFCKFISFLKYSPENSVLDAASNGAFAAVVLIAGITANLIAFVSFVAFLNGIVGWLGILVGYDFLTIEWFFGKLFIPIAFIIGIPWQDCEKIGEIIATKTILNEFVAYQKLGIMKEQHIISVSVKTLPINYATLVSRHNFNFR